MNTSEFKAWFEGFSEAIGTNTLPTADQWKRIKTEVSKLTVETKYIPTTNRDSLFPTKPWDPHTKYGDLTCKSRGATFETPVVSYTYGSVVDSLAKNGTSNPEDALKG